MAKQEYDSKHPCVNCRKMKGSHKAGSLACPSGLNHPKIGYTQFFAHQFFKPRPGWVNKKDDGFRITNDML